MLFRMPANAPRSPLIGMALATCVRCNGTGLTLNTETLCPCVDRGVFKAVHAHYLYCAASANQIGAISLERVSSSRPATFGWKRSEFMIDFELTGKRALADSPIDYGVFRLHFLDGHDWKVCASQFNLSRGLVFHSWYRVQQRVGRALHTLTPHALWPLDQYFQPASRGTRVVAMPARPEPSRVQPLRPPLAA